MVLCNKKMEKLLEKIENKKFRIYDATITLKNLILLLQPKFIEVSSCILLDNGTNPNLIKVGKDENKSYFEFSCNEIIINDYFEDSKGTLDILWFGLKVAECWENELKKQFPNYNFILVLSFDKRTVDIRFLRERQDEILFSIEDYLNDTKEAILLRKF